MDLTHAGAGRLSELIRSGKVSSQEVTRAFLDRIDSLDGIVQAWAYLNRDYAMEQARRADRARAKGEPLGRLHGIPVGIKDIIDTKDMPTEYGTVLYAGWQPAQDAAVVSQLRSAGAVIMGKTVTAELAFLAPGKTRNPRSPEHTPGGSSSGSAAAVAAGMVPLSLGTQTNGSVIRPAAFCGTVGFKPSHGRISRHGILHQSWILDQVGVFASCAADAALLADELISFDSRDPSMRPFPHPDLKKAVETPLPRPPRIAFTPTPVWNQADEETRQIFGRLSEQWKMDIPIVELPEIFQEAHSSYKLILQGDFALNFSDIYRRGADRLSPILRETIEAGMSVPAHAYNQAVEKIPRFNAALEPLMQEYDALITPAAPGPAPLGLDSTGSPIFCTIWTLCGVPAVTLPLLKSANGLPMGVQVVAGRGSDRRLLQVAAWIEKQMGLTH